MRGKRLRVYRSPGVSDSGGISFQCEYLVLVGTKQPDQPITPLPLDWRTWDVSPESPAVVLVESEGQPPVLIPLEYYDWRNDATEAVVPEGMVGPTRGGCYAGATDENGMIDGHWSSLGVPDLVAVYDRVESEASFLERRRDHQAKVAQSQREAQEFQEYIDSLPKPD